MKGRKTEALLGRIHPRELQILSLRHQHSKDKRSQWLANWIACGIPVPDPETWWRKHISPSEPAKNEAETDKIIRRWISFVSRELEKALIWQALDETPAEISGILLRILPPGELEGLTSHYLSSAYSYAFQQGDYEMMLRSLGLQVTKQVNREDENNMRVGLEKLIMRSRLADDFFHRVKIDSLNLLSGMYLDNPSIRETARPGFPTREELELLCLQTQGTPMEAEYRLIQARFHHEDKKTFDSALARSEKIIRKLDGKNRDLVHRRICYLKLIVGYTGGLSQKELLSLAGEIHAVNEKYGFPDSGGFFHFILLLILAGEFSSASGLLSEKADFYFPESNLAMRDFLSSFGSVLAPGEFSGKPSRLQALSYSRNTYVSTWASLVFAAHHMRKGNAEFVLILLGRLKNRLRKLPQHFFTRKASLAVVTWMEKQIKKTGKTSPLVSGLSPLHDAIVRLASGK